MKRCCLSLLLASLCVGFPVVAQTGSEARDAPSARQTAPREVASATTASVRVLPGAKVHWSAPAPGTTNGRINITGEAADRETSRNAIDQQTREGDAGAIKRSVNYVDFH